MNITEESRIEYRKRYYKEHREELNAAKMVYYHKNKEHTNALRKIRSAEIKCTNPMIYRAIIIRNGMRNRSIRKGIIFDGKYFTRDKIVELLSYNDRCPCCNRRYVINYDRNYDRASPTCDRVDPTKGYTKDNVMIICYDCNEKKGQLSLSDMEMISKYIKGFMGAWE